MSNKNSTQIWTNNECYKKMQIWNKKFVTLQKIIKKKIKFINKNIQ
jgi:hypothetical protein